MRSLSHTAIRLVAACSFAGTTLCLGCDQMADPSAELSASQQETAVADAVARTSSDVWTSSDLSVVGSSWLGRHGHSLSMTLKTSDLPAGMAVTVWWVVFNEPENCLYPTPVSQCGQRDIFFNPDVRADVLYAAGHVTGRGRSHTFAAQRRVGDDSGSVMPFINNVLGMDLPSVGLENIFGAEVHLVVRSHGEALPSHMPDMIQTFNGGCLYPPGVPTDFGAPGPNRCEEIQFAVHLP